MSEDIKQVTIVKCPSCKTTYDVPFNGKLKVYEMCACCQYAPYGEYKSDN